MRERVKRILRNVDIRDWHVYGGLVVAALGFGGFQWQAGLVVMGGGLLYLGLRRP